MVDYEPGQQVAVYTHGAGHDSAVLATVERTTATQVVLEGGRRFRKDGREVGEDRSSWTRRELLPADDPRVRRPFARQALSRLTHSLDAVLRVTSVTATPADMLGLLDQAAQQVELTRAEVARLVDEEG